jgi:transposase
MLLVSISLKMCSSCVGLTEGSVVLLRRMRRDSLMRLIGDLEPCLIEIEACTGAFYWHRQFEKHGHV